MASGYEEESNISEEDCQNGVEVQDGSSDDDEGERMTAAEVLEKLEEVSV